jgi:photosystem II stability/assembly factor-like uncharacterized protein
MSPKHLLSPCWHRPLLLAACVFATAAFGQRLAHDFYLCVNVAARSSVMGTKLANLSGLYRVDARATPVHLGFNHIRIESIATDPRDRGRLYAAALNGILRTPDAGASWRIVTGWDMTEAKDIAVDPNEPDNVYAGLPDGLAVSRDRGQTWTRSDEGIKRKFTQSVAVDRTRAGRVFAGTEKGIFLSEDAARTWKLLQATDATVYDIRQSPHDPRRFFSVTQSNGAFVSDDAGATWRPVPGLPAGRTLHNCDFDASDARRLIVSGWGVGVQLSEDGGATWTDRSAGLPRREVWRVAFDPDVPGRLYASVFQNPIFASDDLGRTWRKLWFDSAIVHDFVFIPHS